MKQLKILYDVRMLHSGVKKTAARSGIFFATLNLLKSFAKNENIKLVLFASKSEEQNIRMVLNKEFTLRKFECIFYDNMNFKTYKDTIADILNNQDSSFITRLFTGLLLHLTDFFIDLNLKLQALFKYHRYRNFDVSFSAAYSVPDFVKFLNTKKNYILLHDLTPIIFKNLVKHSVGNDWYFKLLSSLNEKDYYFNDSENTRQDFLAFAPQINPEKSYTTLLGCDFSFSSQENNIDKIKEKYNIPKNKKYLFSLCTLEPRKNLIRIVKTFIEFVQKNNINDLVFVMGGGNYDSFKKELDKFIKKSDSEKILQIGYVDDEDLPVLYNNALWFTYTSAYEGFGLPVLEAMKCGCPVITSNNSSLPEVIGDAGIKIDYNSDKQHIEAYEKYYFDENLRKENAKKGLERAELFTWDKTVNKMLNIMIKNK